MFRRIALSLAAAVTAVVPAATSTTVSAAPMNFPEVIDLPGGFFPEGIAIGNAQTFFTGSLVDGAIYSGDLRTGEGELLVDGVAGQPAVGMDVDRRGQRLFVAGGPAGTARIYDTATGDLVADLDLGAGFVNDVIVTRDAAYFTNSFAPELYEVPLDPQGNVDGPVRTITLSGDFEFVPGAFNANGIVSAGGDRLIVVNSAVGALYDVDAATGVASVIDTGGVEVNGDGLVLIGRTLYAVVGGLNQVTELELAPDLSSARVTDVLTDSDFDVPTTAASRGNKLYVVNAKFGTPPLPSTPYEVVQVIR